MKVRMADKFLKTAVFIIVCVVALTVAPWLIIFHNAPVSTDPAHWGVFGDYLGGVLSTFLSAFGFVGLIYTVIMQRQAVSAQMAAIRQDKEIRDDEVYSGQALACLEEALGKITLVSTTIRRDRLAWLESARLIMTARELSERINSHSVYTVYDAAEKIYRSRFSSLLDPDNNNETMQPAFFGGTDWEAYMAGRVPETIEPRSVYVIYSFLNWQRHESDVLDTVTRDWDMDRISRRHRGARLYLEPILNRTSPRPPEEAGPQDRSGV